MEVLILPASVQERQGAEELFGHLKGDLWDQRVWEKLQLVWADGGFQGSTWTQKIEKECKFRIEIVKRSDDVKGFEVLPRRWIVERSFGWMDRYRRLSKDYEGHSHLSRAWLLWAMCDKMLGELHPSPPLHPFRYRTV